MEIKHRLKNFINKIFWNSYAYVYDDITKYYAPYKQLNSFIIDFITKKTKKGIIFDAGCGTGELSILLSKKYKIIAGDVSPVMINIFNEKIKKNKIKNIVTKIVDLNKKLNFKDKKFDIVINVHSLFMLEDKYRTILEFCRVLKKGGFLIIVHHKPLNLLKGMIITIKKEGFIIGLKTLLRLIRIGFFNIFLGQIHKRIYGDFNSNKIIKFLRKKGFYHVFRKVLYNGFDEFLVFRK
jgi:ubiquinone/menaquinone biosynthesis C-methylase UbiE